MAVLFEPVQLHRSTPDDAGVLAYRDDRLLAVLARLSTLHEGQAGAWFVETVFGTLPFPPGRMFADLDAAKAWIERLPE